MILTVETSTFSSIIFKNALLMSSGMFLSSPKISFPSSLSASTAS